MLKNYHFRHGRGGVLKFYQHLGTLIMICIVTICPLPVSYNLSFLIIIFGYSSYLHSCSPPVIHGNLTCDTIFIQHNGLVKIGSVAPDAIHHHVKTCNDNMKNMHFIAPEYGSKLFAQFFL